MKVLMVHNFYQSSSPSGEDVVFRNEVELLKKNGVDVITYTRHNDEINNYNLLNKLLLPFNNIWSIKTYKEISKLIKKEKPDIAHFHNIWYLISPSTYYACKDSGVPVVQTLHNFRIFCANGLLMRQGRICEECISSKNSYQLSVNSHWIKIIKNAVKYGCYRDSRFHSMPIAFMQCLHWMKKTWTDKVNAYIALTEFGKKKIIEAGLPADKIFVKQNFLAEPLKPNYIHKNYAVFLGRLSAEKGLNIIIGALKKLLTMTKHLKSNAYNPFQIKIIGDGPLRKELDCAVKKEGVINIEFTGRKRFDESMELLRNALFLVMPSICYEGFPMVIREAFACGKPVIASRLGAMAELIEDGKTGLLFEPGNPIDLAEKIKWMLEHEEECIQMGKNAKKVFEEKYTAERNFKILMEIYNSVLSKYQCQK